MFFLFFIYLLLFFYCANSLGLESAHSSYSTIYVFNNFVKANTIFVQGIALNPAKEKVMI